MGSQLIYTYKCVDWAYETLLKERCCFNSASFCWQLSSRVETSRLQPVSYHLMLYSGPHMRSNFPQMKVLAKLVNLTRVMSVIQEVNSRKVLQLCGALQSN